MSMRTVTIFTAFPIGRLARRPGVNLQREWGSSTLCAGHTWGGSHLGWQACLGPCRPPGAKAASASCILGCVGALLASEQVMLVHLRVALRRLCPLVFTGI